MTSDCNSFGNLVSVPCATFNSCDSPCLPKKNNFSKPQGIIASDSNYLQDKYRYYSIIDIHIVVFI